MRIGMRNFQRISVDPGQMDGVPCVRHLRIPVATVLRLLAGRWSMRFFPSILISNRKISANACASLRLQLWSGNYLFRTRLEIPGG